MIEEAMIHFFKKNKIEFTKHEEKYKLKFKIFVTDKYNSKVIEPLEIVMKILKVNNKKCCVEFTRMQGRVSTFLTHFE